MATIEHEWITFKRVVGYDVDHGTPNEGDCRWCANCGALDLGVEDGRVIGRFLTTKGIRTTEPPCGMVATRGA